MKRIALSVMLVLAMVFCFVAVTAPQAQAADEVVHYHCKCGNLHSTAAEGGTLSWKEGTEAHYPGCSEEILTWTKFDITASTFEPGNYYLWDNGTADGVAAKSATIVLGTASVNGEFNIDMNGLDFTMNGKNVKAFQVAYNSTLNLCNTKSTGGTVSALGNASSHSGVVLLSNYNASSQKTDQTATLNLYGVSLERLAGVETVTGSGAVRVTGNCTLNAYDCTITGGYVTGYGGAIEAQSNSIVNLSNVNVVGGTAANGGAISNSGTLTVTGGTITGAAVSADGGAIYNVGTATLTDVTVVGASAVNGGAIRNGGTMTIKGGSITGADVTNVGGAIYTNKTITIEDTAITGATAAGNGGAVCAGAGSFTMTGGSIADGTTTGAKKHGGNLYVGAGTALTLTNVSITGGTSAVNGGNIYVADDHSKAIELTGCTVSGGTAANNGGNLYLGAVAEDPQAVTLSGCTLEGGSAVSGGSVYAGRPVAITDCAVSGGSADNGGGLFLAADATVTDSDFSGSEATSAGGNIYASNTFVMNGGTVTGGNSEKMGGNIYLDANIMATLTAVTVADGEAATHGGNLYMTYDSTGTMTMSGCTVSGGICGENGGNLWIGGASTEIDSQQEYLVKLSDCFVLGGQAKTGGSMIVARRVALNSTKVGETADGDFDGGVATNRGGNVFINDAELVMNGNCVITAGDSGASNGGNVYIGGVNGTGKLTMNNTASLKAGRNTASGGNLYMASGEAKLTGKANIAGGGYEGLYASGTVTTVTGGNVYIASGAVFTMLGNSEVRNGRETSGDSQAGNFYVNGGTLNIGGNASVYGGRDGANYRNIHLYKGSMNMSGTAKVDGGVISQNGVIVLAGAVTVANYTEDRVDALERTLYMDANTVIDATGLTAGAVVEIYDSYVGGGERKIATVTAEQTDIKSWITLMQGGPLDAYVITREKDTEGNVSLWLRQAAPVQLRVGQGDVYDYQTLTDALAAYAENDLVILNADLDGQTIGTSALIDLAGHDLTNVTIPEGVTLYGMDSTTDDYDCSDDYGTISGAISGTVEKHIKTTTANAGAIKRYLTITQDGVTSFHRIYLGITHMSLSPANVAYGYKARFFGDQMVTNAVTGYGYNIWVNDGEAKQCAKTGSFTSGDTLTLRVENILVEGNDAQNQIGSTAAISASAFVNVQLGGETVTITSADYSSTLRSMLETINKAVSTYTELQMTGLQTLCSTFSAYMEDWDIANILSWTPAAEETA